MKNRIATPLIGLEGSSPVNISDDGEVIAFVRNGLWVINSDGTGEQQLVSADDFKSMEPKEPGVDLYQFDWIPGTHTLLFNTRLRLDYGLGYTDDLYTASVETGRWARLRHPGAGGRFLIAHDGQHVVMVTPSKITLMRVDGSDYRTLLEYPSVSVPSEFAYYARPIWATDSQSLMVALPPRNVYYGSTAPTTIWHLPIDGTQAAVVSQLPTGYEAYISPDFSKVVSLRFLRQEDPNTIYEMHISKIDGSEDTIYRTGAIRFEGWASDSEHFVLWLDETDSYYLGKAGEDLVSLSESGFMSGSFSWVDDVHFLYLDSQRGFRELRLGTIGEPSILLAVSETSYDYINFDFAR